MIKELSSQIGHGVGAVFSNWAVYVLLMTGAATFLLVSHALAAGPLAASQPGFTIGDPMTAALLGVFLFDESLRTGAAALTGKSTRASGTRLTGTRSRQADWPPMRASASRWRPVSGRARHAPSP